MKNSLIDTIYFSITDEIHDSECGADYKRLLKEASDCSKELNNKLTEESAQKLNQLIEADLNLQSEWGRACFQAGLKFGVKLMKEVTEEGIDE